MGRILVAEPVDALRNTIVRLLRHGGHLVVCCSTTEELTQRLDHDRRVADVLVADIDAAIWRELVLQVVQQRPQLRVVVISTMYDAGIEAYSNVFVFRKPFGVAELLAFVCDA